LLPLPVDDCGQDPKPFDMLAHVIDDNFACPWIYAYFYAGVNQLHVLSMCFLKRYALPNQNRREGKAAS
jgi:hypothetical protein